METVKNIYIQLFDLQNEIGAISKTETNPFYKSKYVDINGLLEQLKPLLEKHGLIVLQPLTHIEGKPAISTMIASTITDTKLESTIPLPENPDPQKMGAIITYFRRYALQSLFLLQAEDDDAQSAVLAPLIHPQPVRYSNPQPAGIAKGESCEKCGSAMKISKQGKQYCAATCWLKAQRPVQPSIQVDGYSQDEFSPPPFEG